MDPPSSDAASIAPANARDGHDYTALIFAASNGHAEVLKILLKRGADLKARNDVGLTALRAAELFGHTEVVAMLAKAGVAAAFSGGEVWTV